MNEVQSYSVGKVIDSGILASLNEVNLNKLIDALKNKQYKTTQKWVSSNLDNEPTQIFRSIYDNLYEVLQEESIPAAVLIINEYSYKSAFVADQEINLLATY